MKTLILGMGNPILSDDGVGLCIARELDGRWADVDVVTTPMVGLDVLDVMIGYDKIFLIDASISNGRCPGELTTHEKAHGARHLFSSHGVNFFELLQLGKTLGFKMPEVARVFGIEIGERLCFGRELSPMLKKKIGSLVRSIIEDIESSLRACN